MPIFTETKVLQSFGIYPALNVISVKYLNTMLKDDVKFMEQTEVKTYSASQFSDFAMDIAPTGGTLVEIVAGFSQAALDAAAELSASMLVKNAELAAVTAANTAHLLVIAAKDAHLQRLQAQIDVGAPPPVADPLGPTVSDLQIRLAMNQVGLRTAVEAAVAASTDQSLKDWYERAKNFKRHDPMVLGMIQALAVSDTDADGLFVLAASLQG